MNLRYLLSIAAASLALCQPAAAQEKNLSEKLEAINPEVLFKGIIREDDVSLLFRHVRESMAAAARGEEARESEAMKRRAEEIQREVAVRGTVLVGVLLSAFEAAAKQAIREGLSERSSGVPRSAPLPQGSVYPRPGTDD